MIGRGRSGRDRKTCSAVTLHFLFLVEAHSLQLQPVPESTLCAFLSYFFLVDHFTFAVPCFLCLSPSPARHHCLHQVRYCSLSLAQARCFSLALARCLSLALVTALCACLSLSRSHSCSLSLSHIFLISIQDIPCGSKHDVNLPLIIASTTTECLYSWANDLRRDPERFLRFFLASHVSKKSYLQIISIVK